MSDVVKRLQHLAKYSSVEMSSGELTGIADEITALRARLEAVEKERDSWKNNSQGNAAAMNCVEEAVGQILPVGVRAGSERGPEPVEWAADMIAALHKVKARAERAEAALATARRDAFIEIANMKPTREQIANSAMGYDHSFGLMTPTEQENLMHRAGWWLNAWQHAIRALANEAET